MITLAFQQNSSKTEQQLRQLILTQSYLQSFSFLVLIQVINSIPEKRLTFILILFVAKSIHKEFRREMQNL